MILERKEKISSVEFSALRDGSRVQVCRYSVHSYGYVCTYDMFIGRYASYHTYIICTP